MQKSKIPIKIKKALILLTFSIFTINAYGCFDAIELDSVAYVVALGVDEGISTKYKFTFQITKPDSLGGNSGSNSSSGDGSSSENSAVENIVVEAPSIKNAMELAGNFLGDNVSMVHMRIVVISQKLAKKDDFVDLIATMEQDIEFRSNTYIAVSLDESEKYLKSVKPVLHANPNEFFELVFERKELAYVPITNITKIYNTITTQNGNFVVPLVGENKKKSSKDFKASDGKNTDSSENASQKNNQGDQFIVQNYIAGDTNKLSDNKSEIMGMSIQKDGKCIAIADANETLLYSLITGDFTKSYITIADPRDKKNRSIVVLLFKTGAPKYKINYKNKNPKIEVKLNFQLEFISTNNDYDYTKNYKELEKIVSESLKKEILKLLQKTATVYNSDIFQFGKMVSKNYLTYEQYKNCGFNDAYSDAKFKVDINTLTRRMGLNLSVH